MSITQSGDPDSGCNDADDQALKPLFDQIGAIAAAVEGGDINSATDLLNDLLNQRDSELFQELGRMTRKLHDSIRDVAADERATEIAQTLLPDTQDRLAYVLDQTEDAANKTLAAVENALPITDRLTTNADKLGSEWQDQSTISPSIHGAVSEFLERTSEDGQRVRSYLNDALMAQSYQDLTGQVLRSMMTVMQELEAQLVGLVREHGGEVAPPDDKKKAVDGSKAYGPRVDSDPSNAGYVNGQNDVDDLLSSLGF